MKYNPPDIKKVNKKLHFWLFINVLLLLSSILLVFIIYKIFIIQNKEVSNVAEKPLLVFEQKDKENKNEGLVRRNIDGVYVEEGLENIYPVGIMIDNHTDARPSSGLSQANLVYEAEVEGGITRFLAFFASNEKVEKIGPVRSARPYFIDWLQEFAGIYVHCGGSPTALVKITRDHIIDLNEFYKSEYFWRSKTREAPHNIYTSIELLNDYKEKRELTEGTFLSWQFKDDSPVDSEGGDIKIGFQSKYYSADWKYNKEENNYIRYVNGSKHCDIDDKCISAKNVIVQYLEAEVLDSALRLGMDVVGYNDAIVCMDGACQKAIWEKKGEKARTRFYDENDEEIKFNAGTIWIEVVRPERVVSYE